MSAEAARQIAPYLDGINIDLKAFTERFYKKICGARLKPVLETIQLMKELGVWVEVTTLIIPGLNDGEQELRDIARFIRGVEGVNPESTGINRQRVKDERTLHERSSCSIVTPRHTRAAMRLHMKR